MNVSNIWVTFEIHDCQRHIPIYQLAETLGTEKLRVLLKAHILTGCNVISIIGSKTEACKAYTENDWYDIDESNISLPDGRKVPC